MANLPTVNLVSPEQVTDPVQYEVKLANGASLHQLRKTPTLLSGIFTEVLRQLYTAENGLDLEHQWAWVENPTDQKSEIRDQLTVFSTERSRLSSASDSIRHPEVKEPDFRFRRRKNSRPQEV